MGTEVRCLPRDWLMMIWRTYSFEEIEKVKWFKALSIHLVADCGGFSVVETCLCSALRSFTVDFRESFCHNGFRQWCDRCSCYYFCWFDKHLRLHRYNTRMHAYTSITYTVHDANISVRSVKSVRSVRSVSWMGLDYIRYSDMLVICRIVTWWGECTWRGEVA